jgi:hypothetical protein
MPDTYYSIFMNRDDLRSGEYGGIMKLHPCIDSSIRTRELRTRKVRNENVRSMSKCSSNPGTSVEDDDPSTIAQYLFSDKEVAV